MKRYTFGTWNQVMETLRKSEFFNKKFDGAGYDSYELHPTTQSDLPILAKVGHSLSDLRKYHTMFIDGTLYTLIVYKD